MSIRFIALLAVVSVCHWAPSQAGVVTFQFGLSTPTVTATEANFDVLLAFDGNAGDQIEAYQLSVLGSSLELTDPGFGRFSYVPANSPSPLNDWITLGTIGVSGLELGYPLDPILGPHITPSSSPLALGTLVVDLAGIAPGTSLNVSLADGLPRLQTDVGGTFAGQVVFSVASSGNADLMLTFSEPNGVSFRTPSGVVPEPSSVVLWTSLGFVCLVRKRRANRLRNKNWE